MPSIHARLLAAAGALSVVATASYAQADPSVRARKEAALPPGVLPAWEMESEVAPAPPPVRALPRPVMPMPPLPGFRVPAEFEPVAAFVVSQGDWTDSPWSSDVDMLVELINRGTAAGGAGAIVLTEDNVSSYESYLLGKGADLSRAHVLRVPSGLNAKWARDFGPLSLYSAAPGGKLAFVDLHYYNKRPNDDAVAGLLAAEMGLIRYGLEGDDHTPPDDAMLFLEGGNFQTDGMGTCILSNDVPSDNAKENNDQADTLAEAEALLQDYLGCDQVIWLTPPPHTGTGHVDMYTKLLTPTDILVIEMGGSGGNDQEAGAIIEDNVAILENATNLQGEPFQVHRVAIPSVGWTWTYRTYTNSTILNDVVMVPTYDNSTYDAEALSVYESILGPAYTVVGVDSSDIVMQGGAVHCTTMQIASACGDGEVQALLFEACDGQDLGGESCATLGFSGGTLACGADCTLDTSGCTDTPEPSPEAGPEGGTDAGADAVSDADAIAPDTGSGPDAGPDAAPDHDAGAGGAGSDPDAGEEDGGSSDAGSQRAEGGGDGADDGGCSCRQATRGPSPAAWLLVLAGALAWVRRRSSEGR